MYNTSILNVGGTRWVTQVDLYTHTRLAALFPGLPRWASTRKVKPIWILLKQETVSGSSISWAICKSAPHSRQITMPAPHHSVFYRLDALPATQPTVSKHWRHNRLTCILTIKWLYMYLVAISSKLETASNSKPLQNWQHAILTPLSPVGVQYGMHQYEWRTMDCCRQ